MVTTKGPRRRRRPPAPKRTYLPADDRRREILEVAKTVFARSGYHDANIADICRAAKIARGTLYQYFENKHNVLIAILEELAHRVEQLIQIRPQVTLLAGDARAPVELIAEFSRQRLTGTLEALVADGRVLQILAKSRGLDREVDALQRRIEGLIFSAMERDLRFVQAAGIARAGDVRAIVRLMFGGIERLVLSKLSDGEPIDLEEIVPLVVELQLFGLVRDEVRRV